MLDYLTIKWSFGQYQKIKINKIKMKIKNENKKIKK